jgi:hypothetical protein
MVTYLNKHILQFYKMLYFHIKTKRQKCASQFSHILKNPSLNTSEICVSWLPVIPLKPNGNYEQYYVQQYAT